MQGPKHSPKVPAGQENPHAKTRPDGSERPSAHVYAECSWPVSLVIINNFHVPCVLTIPTETNPELAVDPDAPKPLTVAFQLFEAITGRIHQVLNRTCIVH